MWYVLQTARSLKPAIASWGSPSWRTGTRWRTKPRRPRSNEGLVGFAFFALLLYHFICVVCATISTCPFDFWQDESSVLCPRPPVACCPVRESVYSTKSLCLIQRGLAKYRHQQKHNGVHQSAATPTMQQVGFFERLTHSRTLSFSKWKLQFLCRNLIWIEITSRFYRTLAPSITSTSL